MVQRPARSGTGAPRVHRRDVDCHQHDPQPRPLRQGRASADGLPAWSPQNHHAGRRAAHERNGCANGARWSDQRRLVRGLCDASSHTRASTWRCRDHGQSVESQARNGAEAAGATLRFLPPYSPDFNPIEKAFSRLKAMLRKAGERTVSGLWDLIGKLIDIFQPHECANYFSSCGYEPE